MSGTHSAVKAKEVDCHAAVARVLVIGKDPQLGQPFEQCLAAHNCEFDYAHGSADAMRRMRHICYSVVITDPKTGIEEDLALLAEMRNLRPGVRVIVLAQKGTPEEIIAALRARVFLCKTAPFDPVEIADYAAQAATTTDSLVGIEVLSAHRNWISLRINSQLLSAERLIAFLTELQTGLPEAPREELMMAFREILMNALEHGAGFRPGKVIDVAAVHTARSIVFYVHDPGSGFRWETIKHAAVANPEGDLTHHIGVRDEKGMRPGGFGILIAKGVVNELIYSEVGNEVLMIKYTA
jgi:anti-sigma regulatory factor (Ser/Thr protein kinase)/ActR/RegA family two-component response regulator